MKGEAGRSRHIRGVVRPAGGVAANGLLPGFSVDGVPPRREEETPVIGEERGGLRRRRERSPLGFAEVRGFRSRGKLPSREEREPGKRSEEPKSEGE